MRESCLRRETMPRFRLDAADAAKHESSLSSTGFWSIGVEVPDCTANVLSSSQCTPLDLAGKLTDDIRRDLERVARGHGPWGIVTADIDHKPRLYFAGVQQG